MPSFLVTGGCGFIGSHLADALVAAGHRVRILDDLSTGKRANAPSAAEVIVGDVADAGTAVRAMADMDGCYHLAAVASVARSNEDWAGTHRVNLTGAVNIFEAARGSASKAALPVVYVSSAAVYGDNSSVPLSEQAPPRPLTAYGADKLGCELHGRVAHSVHAIPTAGFRFFNIYGPRQDPKSPYSGVISIFVDRLREGLPIDIHGDGKQTRDFVYVDDAVRFLMAGMARLPAASPGVFNVCTGEGTGIAALAKMLGRICGRTVPVRHGPARMGDIRQSVGHPAYARDVLGLVARTPVEEGLRRTVASLVSDSAMAPVVG